MFSRSSRLRSSLSLSLSLFFRSFLLAFFIVPQGLDIHKVPAIILAKCLISLKRPPNEISNDAMTVVPRLIYIYTLY